MIDKDSPVLIHLFLYSLVVWHVFSHMSPEPVRMIELEIMAEFMVDHVSGALFWNVKQ